MAECTLAGGPYATAPASAVPSMPSGVREGGGSKGIHVLRRYSGETRAILGPQITIELDWKQDFSSCSKRPNVFMRRC